VRSLKGTKSLSCGAIHGWSSSTTPESRGMGLMKEGSSDGATDDSIVVEVMTDSAGGKLWSDSLELLDDCSHHLGKNLCSSSVHLILNSSGRVMAPSSPMSLLSLGWVVNDFARALAPSSPIVLMESHSCWSVELRINASARAVAPSAHYHGGLF
jgi:hypothetical protein